MLDSHDRHARGPLSLLTFGGLSLVDSTGAVVGQQRRRLALLALLSAAGEFEAEADAPCKDAATSLP